jgi:hypothetical protein
MELLILGLGEANENQKSVVTSGPLGSFILAYIS